MEDNLYETLTELDIDTTTPKQEIIDTVVAHAKENGYTIYEIDGGRPWGAYIRFDDADADRFVAEFFPGLSPEEARLGLPEAGLSPKLLLVWPKQRLSWQYHNRRAERWHFLTAGRYVRSVTDTLTDTMLATPGTVIQLQTGERHRLVGLDDGLVIVAEIWQHSDPSQHSDEADIVRLSDDYQR